MSVIEDRIAELGYTVPEVSPPLAAYVPAMRVGNHVFTSGQLPMVDGALELTGKVGAEVTAEQAQELAVQCVLNALSATRGVLGSLDKITRVLKVTGFVASDPSFTGQPQVINGASLFLGKVFGDSGLHVRSAVGVAVLPLDAPVEIEFMFEVSS